VVRRRRRTTVLALLVAFGAALLGATSGALPGSGACCPQSGSEGSPCESLSPTTCCETRGALAHVEAGSALSAVIVSKASVPPPAVTLRASGVESFAPPHERISLSTAVLRL
jgi:hypothetical protein